jgi:ElaA protein
VGLRDAAAADLDAATLYRLLRLRAAVFVVEQRCAYQDLDGRDLEPDTRHLWLEVAGAPVAYLRVLADPDGAARIGRVCVDPGHRGRGLAQALMRAALEAAGAREVRLSAQSYLVDFYAGLGFEVTGPEFLEDGIPHLPMTRPAGRPAGHPPTGVARRPPLG